MCIYLKFQNCPVNIVDRQFWGPGLFALALFLYFKISILNLQVPPRDPTKKFKSSYPLCLYLLKVLPYNNHYVKVTGILTENLLFQPTRVPNDYSTV